MAGEPIEELLKTLWLAMSRRRLCWQRKFAPRIGTETGASWNIQSKLQEPKRRGMILQPEQETEDPSAANGLTPEVEDEAGARKTKTEAPESTRKRGEDSKSWR